MTAWIHLNTALSKHLAVAYQATSSLKPDPKNPRLHDKKQIRQIARSIETFGFLVPVLVDAHNRIICGHCRLLAAETLGLKEVPTICVDHLSEAQSKAFLIADNKLTENANWDEALLAQNLKDLSVLDLDFSLEVTGFEVGEIDVLISSLSSVDEIQPDPADQVPPLKVSSVSKLGDLWLLGKHRLYCGDALQRSSFTALMDGQKSTLAFVDPPYNVKINGHVGGRGAIQHREFAMASGELTTEEFTDFLTQAFKHLAENSADGSIHYVCMDFRHMDEVLAAGKTTYTELKNLCVWVKDNGGMGTFYRSQHELIFVFKNGTAAHRNNFELGQHGRYRTNVWQYPGVNSFSRTAEEGNLLELHPTVKPVALVADAIMDCSQRGDIILDSFAGSGTTILAAERTGRRCYAIELDPLYVDTAIRRWQAMTGKPAIHVATGSSFIEHTDVVET